MRLILGDNLIQPSIRDIILIGSFQQDFTKNRKLLRSIGRNNFIKVKYQIKYGGKFGDRLVKFGKSFYSKVLQPGFNKVAKPVYNATKKIIDIAANNDFANNAIKVVGNAVGTALGVPGVGSMISSAAKGADSAIKIGESVVNRLVKDKKLDGDDIMEIINIIKEQIKDIKGKDKEKLDEKAETIKENLKDVDLEKENLTKEDVKDGFKAGLVFYNPVNKKLINKYSGRVRMAGSLKPINPNLLKILPKLMRKIKKNNIKISSKPKLNSTISSKDTSKENGRVFMAGVDKSDLNDIQSKLNALKSKYK